jgi:hypothetical protein
VGGGTDFIRGPGAFTNATGIPNSVERRLIQATEFGIPVAITNNASGDAIASNRSRGGTPQREGLGTTAQVSVYPVPVAADFNPGPDAFTTPGPLPVVLNIG